MGVADLFNEGNLLKVRLICYGILIFFSFFIFSGVAVMLDKADGHCPLYLDRVDNKYYYASSLSTCQFPIAIAVLFQLVYVTLRMITLILFIIEKISEDNIIFSTAANFVYVLLDLLACLQTFVGACILSAGSQLPDHLFVEWRTASEIAQAGAWISTFVWLFVGLVGFFVLRREGKIPCLGGNRQASSQPKQEGGTQAEIVDPAAERFGL